MTSNHKVTGRALSMPASFAIGEIISLCLTMILSALLAKLISTEKLEWEKAGYGIMAILLIASIVGTKATCLLIKRRKLMSCVVSGVLYWLGLLIITALFYGGQYSGIGVTGIVILCGSAMVCLWELKGERRRNLSFGRGKLSKKRLQLR